MTDLIEFIEQHRPHGTLTANATEATEQGYMLTVECSCGVTFMLWITEADAVSELTWVVAARDAELRVVTCPNAWTRSLRGCWLAVRSA